MTTPNIEWLIGHLRAFSGTSLAPALMHQAADTLQSQAERIKVLERESETHSKAYGLAIVERDALRAELAAIAATEPVWFHKVGVHGEHRFYDQKETQPENCTPLFTRPMPAQDVTELVEALEQLARLGNGDQYGNSDGNMIARTALSKYKGAK